MRRYSAALCFLSVFCGNELQPRHHATPPPGWSASKDAQKALQAKIDAAVKNQDAAQAVAALKGLCAHDNGASLSPNSVAAVLRICENRHEDDELSNIIDHIVKPNKKFWTENILTLCLRMMCRKGDVQQAAHALTFVMKCSGGVIKHRQFAPFLALCSATGQRDNALALVASCCTRRDAANVEMTCEDFENLVRLLCQVKEPIATLHWLLEIVSPYLPAVPPSVASLIQLWIDCTTSSATSCKEVGMPESGVCPRCSATIQGFPFTARFRHQLLTDLTNKVVPARCRSKRALTAFETWKRFVSTSMDGVDIIIDAANVGYYGVSKWYGVAKQQLIDHRQQLNMCMKDLALGSDGKAQFDVKALRFVDVPLSMDMIELAVEECKRRNMKPLIVMHERHVEPHNLFPAAKVIVDRWRRQQMLYTTPSGLNDDLCWLYAAVFLTTPSDAVGCRRKVLVLTNDKMRDHCFQLLSPKAFAPWRDRHRMGFSCVREDNVTSITFHEPPRFTRCTQKDPNLDAYHIPIQTVVTKTDGDPNAPESDTEDEISDGSLEGDKDAGTSDNQRWLCLR